MLALLQRVTRLSIGTIGAIALTTFASYVAQEYARRDLLHTRDALRLAAQALALAADRETGIRGYLITHDPASLAPEIAARVPARAKLDTLERLSASSPGEHRRARAMVAAYDTWDSVYARPVLAGTRPATRLAGKGLFDRIRDAQHEIFTVEDARWNEATQHQILVQRGAAAALVLELVVLALALRTQRRGLGYEIQRSESRRLMLEDRTAELERANRALETFASAVAHDLRAPLRTINGYATLLQSDLPGDTIDAQAHEYLERIRASSVRAAGLIDGLLEVARVQREPLTRADVDVTALARRIADELTSHEPGRSVEWRIEPGLHARADATLLGDVLQNLFGNALKFTRGREPTVITFGHERPGAASPTVYYVRDNGVGFDPAFVDDLFQPFHRLHTPDEFEGTGIGLATVRRIVERHGGRVWAEAVPEGGATFYFTLE